MATWKTVCEIAAALPLTALGSRLGAPVWRVNEKVFVQLGGRLRVPGEEEIVRRNGDFVMVGTDLDEREALLQERPETFFLTPYYERQALVLVWLRTAHKSQLREVVTDAWRKRLTKTQLRQLGDSGGA